MSDLERSLKERKLTEMVKEISFLCYELKKGLDSEMQLHNGDKIKISVRIEVNEDESGETQE